MMGQGVTNTWSRLIGCSLIEVQLQHSVPDQYCNAECYIVIDIFELKCTRKK